MKISLNKANKNLAKLKSAASASEFSSWILSATPSHLNVEQVGAAALSLAEEARKELGKHLDIVYDVGELKEALFAANHQSGVSKKLARIAFLKGKINLYKHGLADVIRMGDSVITAEKVARPEFVENLRKDIDGNKGSYHGSSIFAVVFDKAHLETAIEQALVEISDLEDEVSALNASTEIDVDFTDASKRVLGLKV